MTTTDATDRFTELPDDQTIADTVVALEEHGFSVEVVDDLDAARETVLARIPEGSSVMTNPSVTLQETGIRGAIDDSGPYDSARNKLNELDFATQLQEMKKIGGQPDFSLGSVHAITREGALFIASASGSQLASYAWGATNVILVVGAQKPSRLRKRHASGSSSTACRSRTLARMRPTGRTASSARSSRSTRSFRTASTSSSSGRWSGSDRGKHLELFRASLKA